MARLISAALTTAQVIDRTKTVTRRLGWKTLRPGVHLTVCEKVMGRRAGEPLVRLADVKVVRVTREPLNAITASDVRREGFPDWTPEQFVTFFCDHMKVTPDTEVTRIQWRYLPTPPADPGTDA